MPKAPTLRKSRRELPSQLMPVLDPRSVSIESTFPVHGLQTAILSTDYNVYRMESQWKGSTQGHSRKNRLAAR
jgi:hypothetical protein